MGREPSLIFGKSPGDHIYKIYYGRSENIFKL